MVFPEEPVLTLRQLNGYMEMVRKTQTGFVGGCRFEMLGNL